VSDGEPRPTCPGDLLTKLTSKSHVSSFVSSTFPRKVRGLRLLYSRNHVFKKHRYIYGVFPRSPFMVPLSFSPIGLPLPGNFVSS